MERVNNRSHLSQRIKYVKFKQYENKDQINKLIIPTLLPMACFVRNVSLRVQPGVLNKNIQCSNPLSPDKRYPN